MKAILSAAMPGPSGEGARRAEAPPLPSEDTVAALLAEIGRLGGEERMQGAAEALKTFEAALTDLVRANPAAYGAGADPASQRRAVDQLLPSVRDSFLERSAETLRRQAGYVRICGRWVHRAVFTFVGFGLLAAAMLPFCAVSLLSSTAWGWVPGVLGLVFAFLLGAWILSRIQIK